MSESFQLEHLINQLQFHYSYALDLIKDVEEEQMTFVPSKGLENHPTFTIGHLITAYGLCTKALGGAYTIKEEWDDIFRRKGPGDPRYPTLDNNLYPNKSELIDELKIQHDMLLKYLREVTNEKLMEAITWRFNSFFPKTIDLLYFMCISHYAMHLSQLAAWRRAMGLPSSLGRM